VELEITPEPSPEERVAIEAALAAGREQAGEPGAWWTAGLPETDEDESANL